MLFLPDFWPMFFPYSVTVSFFCTHHTGQISHNNKQNTNRICHFDRMCIAFIAFYEVSLLKKAGKIMADSSSIHVKFYSAACPI